MKTGIDRPHAQPTGAAIGIAGASASAQIPAIETVAMRASIRSRASAQKDLILNGKVVDIIRMPRLSIPHLQRAFARMSCALGLRGEKKERVQARRAWNNDGELIQEAWSKEMTAVKPGRSFDCFVKARFPKGLGGPVAFLRALQAHQEWEESAKMHGKQPGRAKKNGDG